MAVLLKEKRFGTLVLVVLIGIIIGAFLNALVQQIPGGDNVFKTFFTYSIPFGVGGFAEGNPNPVIIDLNAIKFQFGFHMKFSLLSILGIILSLYFFRWYK
ncbi:MAG: DUF4321 domain-containing protein [Chitinispirillia bacterium]|nr:DUF4321 domain-containing protein [Chitinispirillia bacterium]